MLKKILAVILSILTVFSLTSVYSFSAFAEENPNVMKFGNDGKFKIVVFADTQDDETPQKKMIQFMGQALDREQPDLVVFTGDNVHVTTEANFRKGATALLQPLIERDIPYAYTFGNHDAEYISKPFMHSVYMTLGRCLTYNADDSIFGYGNCNIPIYSSSGNSIAFNLWIIDSNMYPSSGSGYDNVHQDQLDWFTRTDQALEAQQGHKVNSLVFQHICLPEIYNCLTKASAFSSGQTKTYNGTKYKLKLNSNASGYLGEFPCPPNTNSGEFTTLKNRGDVIGVVTGHDHANSFVGRYNGIDFIQMPGMTFQSYGDDNSRGYGVIELDESNTSTYTSRTVRYIDAYEDVPIDYSETNPELYRSFSGTTYISDIKCAEGSDESETKNMITSAGYTVIDSDLNKGARGQYIYMGYKTTTNYADAIKDLRFYSDSADFSGTTEKFNINGIPCTYIFDKTDLNKGSGGDYIYACYTKNNNAGPAITGISFSYDLIENARPCEVLFAPTLPAELNNGTTTHENNIYCYTSTNVETVDISELKAVYNELSVKSVDGFSEKTSDAFKTSLNEAGSFITALEADRVTSKSVAEIKALQNAMTDSYALLTTFMTDGGFIFGFEKPTLPAELDGQFNSDYAEVTYQPSNVYMGTGSTVTLEYNGRQSVYTAVVFGDVNGDAWYDGQDAAIVTCIADGMLSEDDIGTAAYMAADCNHDGVVDVADCEILEQAGVLLLSVDQSKSIEELKTSSVFVEYMSLIDQNPVLENEPTKKTFCEKVKAFFEKIADFFINTFSKIKLFITNVF